MAAPIHPRGAKSDKIWRDAIMRAVRRLEDDPCPRKPKNRQRLECLADALVAKGLTGDVPAAREIGDRLDGKAVQQIAGPDGGAVQIETTDSGSLARTLAFLLQREADKKAGGQS